MRHVRHRPSQHIVPVVLAICMLTDCQHHNANVDLRQRVKNSEVRRIEILAIPRDVQILGISAEHIEDRYFVKLDLRGAAVAPEVKGLDQALADTECAPANRRQDDVRTAIIFYDIDNKKIRSFYYELGDGLGQVDETPCRLGPGLLNWARNLLPETL